MKNYTPEPDKIIHHTRVDFISRDNINKPIHLVQYDDKLPILAVELFSNGQSYTIPTNAKINIKMGKKDNTYIDNPALGCDKDRRIAYFEITQQMTVIHGENKPVIEVVLNGTVAASSPILIMVDKNPIQQGMIESTSEYKTIEGYVEQTLQATADALDYADVAEKAMESAKTSETIAIQSAATAKTSASSAIESANSAKTSETSARTAENNASTHADKAAEALQEILDMGLADNTATASKSDNSILITDSAEGKIIDFEAYGESEQTQYSGKNKLIYPYYDTTMTKSGIVWTDNKDGTITANGTNTVDGQNIFNCRTRGETVTNGNPLVLPAGTYILTGCPSDGSTAKYYIQVGRTIDGAYSNLGIDRGSGVTFTLEEDTQIQIQPVIASLFSVSNIVFKPMIRLASIADSTYEPYVGGMPSPNPDHPQAIKSVGDSGWFDGELLRGFYHTSTGIFTESPNYVCDKNAIPCRPGDSIRLSYADDVAHGLYILYYDKDMNYLSSVNIFTTTYLVAIVPDNAYYFRFDIRYIEAIISRICVTINDKYALIAKSTGKNSLSYPYYNSTHTEYGITWTDNGDGTIGVSNGTATADCYFVFRHSNADDTIHLILPKGTYTISGGTDKVILRVYKIENNITTSRLAVDNGSGATFTITEDTRLNVQLLISSGTTITSTVIKPMIRPAGTDGTYEPYKETVSYIPISAPLRSSLDGSVRDVARLVDGKVTRKITEVVFDGSENFSGSLNTLTNTLMFYIKPTDMKNAGNIASPIITCSHFVNKAIYNNDIEGIQNSNGYIYIRITKSRLSSSDLAGFKAWLRANPITVQYELAEPITETIEPIDIHTFKGVTQISVSDDAEMNVEYFRNSGDGERLLKIHERLDGESDTINNTLGYIHYNKNIAPALFDKSTTWENLMVTVHEDGSFTLNGTTINDMVMYTFTPMGDQFEENTDYILSGCPSNNGGKYYLSTSYYSEDGEISTIVKDTGDGVKFTNGMSGPASLELSIDANTTLNNVTFYPMIRRADVTDDIYRPKTKSVDDRLKTIENFVSNKIFTKYISIPAAGSTNAVLLSEECTVANTIVLGINVRDGSSNYCVPNTDYSNISSYIGETDSGEVYVYLTNNESGLVKKNAQVILMRIYL